LRDFGRSARNIIAIVASALPQKIRSCLSLDFSRFGIGKHSQKSKKFLLLFCKKEELASLRSSFLKERTKELFDLIRAASAVADIAGEFQTAALPEIHHSISCFCPLRRSPILIDKGSGGFLNSPQVMGFTL
jgi:hypothetical protein